MNVAWCARYLNALVAKIEKNNVVFANVTKLQFSIKQIYSNLKYLFKSEPNVSKEEIISNKQRVKL